MIGKIGTALALAFVAVSTAILALLQVVALKTGLGNPHLFPRLWHRCVLMALGFRVRTVGTYSPHRPLLIAVTRDRHDAMQPWRDDMLQQQRIKFLAAETHDERFASAALTLRLAEWKERAEKAA